MASSPIRNYDDIYLLFAILKQKHGVYGDLALVQFQWGLRFQTAAELKVRDARHCLKFGSVELLESKTAKKRVCGLNERVRDVFMRWVSVEREDDELLWGRKVCRENYNLKLKVVGTMLGMDTTKLSSHSLRKSFAYQLRVKFGVDVQTISEQMNHSSVKTTLIYAGLAEDEKVKLTQLGL